MSLEKLVVVSGMPGIYKMVANRNNGLIVADLDSGKKKFTPARKHQFTPLGSVAIFTLADSADLLTIFQKMLEQLDEYPPPSEKASSAELHAYFKVILPDYDRERVYDGDIKKVIKWFNFLHSRNMISSETVSDEEE